MVTPASAIENAIAAIKATARHQTDSSLTANPAAGSG